MESRIEILNSYINNVPRPSFNNFVLERSSQIQSISNNIEATDALDLERVWVSTYNQVIQTQRPDIKLQADPTSVSCQFKSIYLISKEAQKAAFEAAIAMLRASGSVNMCAAKLLETSQPSSTSTQQLGFPAVYIDNLNDVERIELQKLDKSQCICLLSNNFQSYYESSLSTEDWNSLNNICSNQKAVFDNNLNQDVVQLIDTLFEGLIKFQFDSSNDNIMAYLDDEKSLEKNKKSDHYLLLCIIEHLVRAIPSFDDDDSLSENTFLRQFEYVLDFLFINTRLRAKDGGSVCSSKMINNEETSSGRQLDLIIVNRHNDKRNEICSLKFKKQDATFSTLIKQQSKNMRINACILNEIHLLLNDNTTCITYMDFSSTHGYIAQLFKFEERFICHKVGSFSMIKSLLELGNLKKSIINLYKWKADMISKSNIISLANINQEYKYDRRNFSRPLVRSPPRSPNQTIKPAKIVFSPSKSEKRSRRVFEGSENKEE